jgi:hypothetical protein
MKQNQIAFKDKYTNVEKFISIFNGISSRSDPDNVLESYKYEQSTLILVDFSQNPVKIYESLDELKKDGIVSPSFNENYEKLTPKNFSKGIISKFKERHKKMFEK